MGDGQVPQVKGECQSIADEEWLVALAQGVEPEADGASEGQPPEARGGHRRLGPLRREPLDQKASEVEGVADPPE